MREICPSCGKDMVATKEAFEVNGDAVRGIPHLLCRSCGEATFTAEQLDMVFGYRTAQKQRSMKTEDSRTLDATDAAEIRFLVDAETLGWLERESARTGISLEKVASAMLRKACNETPALGAPGATVSAGRAETAEVRCDARRRSAMIDMERMVYKGFESTPKHDAERGVFYGLVDDVDGLCEYESETADGIEKAFRDAVDDYLDACRESFGQGRPR